MFVLAILAMVAPFWARSYYKSDVIFAAFLIGGMIFLGSVVLMMNLGKRMGEGKISIPKVVVDNFGKKTAPFHDATGAHAGALLGDVLHDPFQSGGLGTPAHERVIAGMIHKAKFLMEKNILSSEKKSVLIESLVFNHLSRAFYNMRPSDIYDPADIIFYAKTNKGYEVDFVFKAQDILGGIEVKYQNTLNSGDFRGLIKIGKGCLISKTEINQKNRMCTIPVSLFLLYI